MSECSNCAGGLHPICAGNCYCGCPTSHKLEKYVDLTKYERLEKILERIHQTVMQIIENEHGMFYIEDFQEELDDIRKWSS